MKFKELHFGTAGIPLCTEPYDILSGIKEVKKLGLSALELEFVRSVNIKEQKAGEVKKVAEEVGITLSCHGQYFINLASKEKEKIKASKQRILKAARIANLCGAFSVCFHAAFYQGRDPKKIYEIVKKELTEVVETLQAEDNNIWVRPETTGKGSQFGSLEEILDLSCEIPNVMPCIDYAHLHARTNKINTYDEFCDTLNLVEKKLGKKGLNNMHIHLAGIAYSEKGEKNHLNLKDSDMNYKDLTKAWKEYKIKGVVISESPNIEKDALLVKKEYSK